MNLLDWSVNNHLAVALGSNVYLWNASSGGIIQLLQLDNPEEYIGAVSWVTEGNILAVGTSGGEVQVQVFLTLRGGHLDLPLSIHPKYFVTMVKK